MRRLLATSTLVIGLTFAPLSAHSVSSWTIGIGILTTIAGAGVGSVFGSWADDKSGKSTIIGAVVGGVVAGSGYLGLVALRRCYHRNQDPQRIALTEQPT